MANCTFCKRENHFIALVLETFVFNGNLESFCLWAFGQESGCLQEKSGLFCKWNKTNGKEIFINEDFSIEMIGFIFDIWNKKVGLEP